jgi:hypothetical protein
MVKFLFKRTWFLIASIFSLALIIFMMSPPAVADQHTHSPDPAHNTPLPCEALSTPGLLPRSAHNIAHLANVCGFVGTDVEFQSRMAADGLHDYAFVGTMGAGLRIFDITDPAHPALAGAYTDPGWQNDVQVRGDIAVIGFDPVGGVNPSASACLQSRTATGGVDIVSLNYDPATATFQTSLLDCVANNPGGAHNSTLHPGGQWLAFSNPRTEGSVDVVDLLGAPALRYRIVQANTLQVASVCPTGASFTCISNGRPGNWSPHDIHFSRDGSTMYVAAVGDDTVIVDVSRVLEGQVSTIGVVPNDFDRDGSLDDDEIEISHQSDVSADGKILVITDERGGGLNNTNCNAEHAGVIGGMHFWALSPVSGLPGTLGASPSNPKRIGSWFYPNPLLAVDALDPVLAGLGRTERGCTIHVFRLGGNGSASPGPIHPDFDGVSVLPDRKLVTAHYGAGVWHLDFSGLPTALDGTLEDTRTTWGNTLGWNVMPGADTWSAKEYKGFIYAGDMSRGFDVYSFTPCQDLGCIILPTNLPGSANGGGKVEGELAEFTILRGTAVGGRATFGFSASYATGQVAPDGHLNFKDKDSGKDVKSTSIDSFAMSGNKAIFTGRALVNGVPGVPFFVEVEDGGGLEGSDSFRLVVGDGYAAFGFVDKGNIQVQSDS